MGKENGRERERERVRAHETEREHPCVCVRASFLCVCELRNGDMLWVCK